jgi:hypothetical protein
MANITIVLFTLYTGIYRQGVCKLLYYIKVDFLSKIVLGVIVKIITVIILTF